MSWHLSSNSMDLPLDLMLDLIHNSPPQICPRKSELVHGFTFSRSLSEKYWTHSSHFLSGGRVGPKGPGPEPGPGHSFPGAGRHTCLSGCNLFEPCEAISSLSKSSQQTRTALLLLHLVVLNLLKLSSILSRRILPGRRLRRGA